MMEFTALASSSHGNAYLVSDGNSRILLECGISHRKLQQLAGFSLSGLAACLVSHEHKDHSRAVGELLKNRIPVFLSEGTAEALELISATADGNIKASSNGDCIYLISNKMQFSVGSFDVVPFSTFHDAREPLGFLIKSRLDGESLVFATDTVNLGYRFPGITYLAIEANYDPEILARCERIPEKVRRRITNSHMEIGRLCEYIKSLDLSRCKRIYLLHLSDGTSHEGHFINKVSRAVDWKVDVVACGKEASCD